MTNIFKIKDIISDHKGKNIIISIKNGRQKKEIIEGIIVEIYDRIFILNTINGFVSFSYADVLSKKIEIKTMFC